MPARLRRGWWRSLDRRRCSPFVRSRSGHSRRRRRQRRHASESWARTSTIVCALLKHAHWPRDRCWPGGELPPLPAHDAVARPAGAQTALEVPGKRWSVRGLLPVGLGCPPHHRRPRGAGYTVVVCCGVAPCQLPARHRPLEVSRKVGVRRRFVRTKGGGSGAAPMSVAAHGRRPHQRAMEGLSASTGAVAGPVAP